MSKKQSIVTPGAGDVKITLGGEDLVLKATLNAGLTISRLAGGIRGAMEKVIAMDLDTITTVVTVGLGQEEAKRLKNIDRLVFENGLTDAQGGLPGKCIEFLANLARGGRPADSDDAEGGEDPTNPQ